MTHMIRKYIRGFTGADVLRCILFFCPYLLPLIWVKPWLATSSKPEYVFEWIIVNSIFVIIILICDRKRILPFLNKEMYTLYPVFQKKWYLITIYSLIGSAVFEELFFRAFVPKSNALISLLLSITLFVLSHYIQKPTRNKFSTRDYINLTSISTVFYVSLMISGSIIPSIIGHLIYNSTKIIGATMQYYITNKIEE
ncbi:CPBP family intramembrane metalloprotease [Listeria rocourtiae]|nr:CPBP family intramembrane metalloprotease [Listeria rocourtiae]